MSDSDCEYLRISDWPLFVEEQKENKRYQDCEDLLVKEPSEKKKQGGLPHIHYDHLLRMVMELAYVFNNTDLVGKQVVSKLVMYCQQNRERSQRPITLRIRYCLMQCGAQQYDPVGMFMKVIQRISKYLRVHGTSSQHQQQLVETELDKLRKYTEGRNYSKFETVLEQLEASQVFAQKSVLCMLQQVTFSSAFSTTAEKEHRLFIENERIQKTLIGIKKEKIFNVERVEEAMSKLEKSIEQLLKINPMPITIRTSTSVENDKADSRGVKISFRKPLTDLERIHSSSDSFPKPREPAIDMSLEMDRLLKLNYSIKLTTRHQMLLQYSDVFARQLSRIFGEANGVSFDFTLQDGRKYVAIKMSNTISFDDEDNWGSCILQRLMRDIDRLLMVNLVFDTDLLTLYTQCDESDVATVLSMINHYTVILDMMGEIFMTMYARRRPAETHKPLVSPPSQTLRGQLIVF